MEQNTPTIEIPKGKKVGKVTHYFDKIGVGVVELVDELKVGDTVVIVGHQSEFEQVVDSMQAEHEPVTTAKKGDAVGMKMVQPVKAGDLVHLKG